MSQIPRAEVMTPFNTMVLQVTVMGLTVTEWMAKMKEEVMTYDLISAMATDFFFAYDAIDFFMLAAVDKEVYGSGWVYVTFVTGFVAMFKYVPTQPATIKEYGAPKGAATCILVGMICNDIPFVVVRLMTLTEFGLQISDLIHPAKNIAMILFGITQLYIIFYNTRASRRAVDEVKYEERRCLRRPTLKPADWAAGSVLKNTAGGAIGGWDCDATRFWCRIWDWMSHLNGSEILDRPMSDTRYVKLSGWREAALFAAVMTITFRRVSFLIYIVPTLVDS